MLFPHTETRRVALRQAGAKDATEIYDILFRLGRGELPMIDRYVEAFGQGLSACFLVQRKDTEATVGVVTLADLALAGHVRAEVSLAAGQPAEVRTDAHALAVNFAFAMWRVRKVYLHATEEGAEAFGFDGEHEPLVRREAVLPDYVYFHGRLWDVHVSAVYRDDWDTRGADLLKQII